jgi:hypothetical protein
MDGFMMSVDFSAMGRNFNHTKRQRLRLSRLGVWGRKAEMERLAVVKTRLSLPRVVEGIACVGVPVAGR